jgi:steroid 5-alpha reductase family enzyme
VNIVNPYFIILLLLWGFLSLIWLIAQIIKNNSIIDIVYGTTYIIAAIASIIISQNYNIRAIILTSLVVIWGARLSIYLLIRNWGKPEDFRYQNFRKNWGNHPMFFAYIKVFMLQGAIVYAICFPVLFVNFSSARALGIQELIGIAIWVIGFYFEAVGDAQLKTFKSNPENKGKVMNQGLWKFTRHPNYFGEATMWWGIYIIAAADPNAIFTIFSPILITFLLLKVSGVTMLEKKYEGSPEYIEYQKRTSAFLPRPPKKAIKNEKQ